MDKSTLKLSAAEKASLHAGKSVLADLKKGDFNREDYVRIVNARRVFEDTILQMGEGKGKRISGATEHGFEAQSETFANIVAKGNIPSIGKAPVATVPADNVQSQEPAQV